MTHPDDVDIAAIDRADTVSRQCHSSAFPMIEVGFRRYTAAGSKRRGRVMAGRWLGGIMSATLTLAAGAGLLAMAGGARGVVGADLRAEVHVTDYPLPTGFGIDPELVAEFLSASLQKRAGEDIALRLSLRTEELKRLQEIALPRLMNVVVVRAMIREVKPLNDLLAVGAFRRVAQIVVTNAGAAATDVALTLPGAVLAEVGGATVPVLTTDTGLTAVGLGDMAAGEKRALTVWLGADAVGIDLGYSTRIGAEGRRGKILLTGQSDWAGADLEAMAWARWTVNTVLLGAFVFGVVGLLLPFFGRRNRRSRPADSRVVSRA